MKKLKILARGGMKRILITISIIVGIFLAETTIRFFSELENEKKQAQQIMNSTSEIIRKKLNSFRKTYLALIKNDVWDPTEFPEVMFYAVVKRKTVVDASSYAPFKVGTFVDTPSIKPIYETTLGPAFALFAGFKDAIYIVGVDVKKVMDPLKTLLGDFVVFKADGSIVYSSRQYLKRIEEIGLQPGKLEKTMRSGGTFYIISDEIHGTHIARELKLTEILKRTLKTLPLDVLVFSSAFILLLLIFHHQTQTVSNNFVNSVRRILAGDSLDERISEDIIELRDTINSYVNRLKAMYAGIRQILYTEIFYNPKEIDFDRFLFSTFTKYSKEIFPTASSFSIFKKKEGEYQAIDFEGSLGIPTMDTLSKLRIPESTVRRVLKSLKPVWLKKEEILDMWEEFNIDREELERFLLNLKDTLIIPIMNEDEIKAFIIVGFSTEEKDMLYEEAGEMVTFELNLVYKRLEDIREMYRISITDPLTGIYNRRYFMERLQEEVQRARRYKEDVFSISILDIDDLKRINDSYGHQVGDELIKAIAEYLKNFVRESDVVGRIGGDEFGIIWMHTDSEVAKWVQKRLIDGIEALKIPSIPAEKILVSVGTSTFGVDGFTTDELIKAADDRMYEMKRRRKGDK